MKKTVAIVGGGACALMLGCELDPKKYEVSLYEKNVAFGRKFLVAGYGGLNITHSEELNSFISRYQPRQFLEPALSHFSNKDLIKWLNALGIETYVGSSGRVFPKKGIKAVEVLNVFLNRIAKNKFNIHYKHEWKGFSENGDLLFENNADNFHQKFDTVIFCLGGASWPVTGSKGDWIEHFTGRSITCLPFMPSNCAFGINWTKTMIAKIEGKALKNCMISCGNKKQAGEIVLTKFGIEGSGIYPFSAHIREQLHLSHHALIHVDLKPNLSKAQLMQKLNGARNGKKNYTDRIKLALNLNEVQLALLKGLSGKEEFLDKERLCEKIKNLELHIHSTAPIEEAISTVGGISLEEINEYFELKKMKDHFVVGEMLDYDAPTGGYLLQSCFSMGKYLADHLNADKDDRIKI